MVKQLISLFSYFDYDDKRKFALFLYRISYMNRAFAGFFGFLAEATIITLNLTVLNLSINTISVGAVILILLTLFIEKIFAEKYKYFLDKYGKITDERNLPNVKDGSIAGSLLLFVIPIILIILTYTGNIKFSSQLLFLEASFFNTSGLVERSYLVIRTVLYSCIILFCVASFLQAFSVWYYNWIQIDNPYNLPFCILHKIKSVIFSAFIEGKLIGTPKEKTLNKIELISKQDASFRIRFCSLIISLMFLGIISILPDIVNPKEGYMEIIMSIFYVISIVLIGLPIPMLVVDINNPEKIFTQKDHIPRILKSPSYTIYVSLISLVLIIIYPVANLSPISGYIILFILACIPVIGWPFVLMFSFLIYTKYMKENTSDISKNLENIFVPDLFPLISIENAGAILFLIAIYILYLQMKHVTDDNSDIQILVHPFRIYSDLKDIKKWTLIVTQLFHMYSLILFLSFINTIS